MIKKYIDSWITVMVRPILFFQRKIRNLSRDDSINFALITSGILALFLTSLIFIKQYLNIGLSFISGITGIKIAVVFPVLLAMAAVFFLMTFMALVLVVASVIFILFVFSGILLFYASKLLGGHANLEDNIKASLYTCAVSILLIIPFFLIFFSKWVIIMPYDFVVGENIAFYFGTLYLYGLWSIASKNLNKIPRWKAFVVAAIPSLFFVLVNIVINLKLISKVIGGA